MSNLNIHYANIEKTAVTFQENGTTVVVPLDSQGWMRRILDDFLAKGGVFKDYVDTSEEKVA
jgi:hypothetical protein